MDLRIAIAGNPNCGKTTLFNLLTGSNQYVGNWPGVTVEKKEGKLKKQNNVVITDLPGIYSLSPYTPEEIVARNYLIGERPDAILNLVDGTNLERNLYLTTQLSELGIPVVVAINMMDVVRKQGDKIDIDALSCVLGCPVVEISALKGTGISEAVDAAIEAAKAEKTIPSHYFSGTVEHVLAHIEEAAVHALPEEQQRWYAIKIFERDENVLSALKLPEQILSHIEEDIRAVESELDDDAESIITNERYVYVGNILKGIYRKKSAGKLSVSDKIDKVVTNRWAAIPIFALVMFLVYFISVTTVGSFVTDFTNDGLFGEGWYLLGIGSKKYETAVDDYLTDRGIFYSTAEYVKAAEANGEVTGIDDLRSALGTAYSVGADDEPDATALIEAVEIYGAAIEVALTDADGGVYYTTLDAWLAGQMEGAPQNSDFGVWVPGLGVLAERGLSAINCVEWLKSLVVDGIIGGVGAVLGFVPQMLVLFLLLGFLESCGYMSRVAFVMDRLFRRFGLSGKSVIPMLIGSGCSVPGIMASRTIESENDRRMTVLTTSFVPCGAKMPVIALIASAFFGNSPFVAVGAYFIGVSAVLISGVALKKTKMFAGDPAPFVMELPAYHMPTPGNLLRSTWDRGWSFIKKAGTVILLSSVLIWAGSYLGVRGGVFGFYADLELEYSILGYIGNIIKWVFLPLGFADARAAVATILGLVAKEEIVAVFGILDFEGFTALSAMSFLLFNLLCAPCFAAMGAMRREMNSRKWFWFAIGYQTALAYAVSFVVYNVGAIFVGEFYWWEPITLVISLSIVAAVILFLIFKKPHKVKA